MSAAGSAAPEPPSNGSSEPRFDAFLSYSSADRPLVRRIQRFLESYRPPGRPHRLKVYLDETDMRGGSLPENLSLALDDSRALVVCWSDAAARSRWVRTEIEAFRKLGRERSIAIVHIGGAGPTVKDQALRGIEPIEHDLRGGWWSGFLTPKGRLELLRLIAFLTGVEMRALRNWARRRALRNAAAPLALALVPAALLLVPQAHWDPVPLSYREEPITPIGCEVVDGKLWVVSWDESVGEVSGARAFFVAYPDVLSGAARPDFRARTFHLPKRALPSDMAPAPLQERLADLLAEAGVDRGELPPRDIRVAEPRPGHLVAILPRLHPTVDPQVEQEAIRQRLPFPETAGSVVVVRRQGAAPAVARVDGLSPPLWRAFRDDGRRTPPARAISVVWQDDGQIWVGVAGERDMTGGLWHSTDAGSSWQRVDGFSSVTSIEVRDAGTQIIVAEQGIRQLRGTQIVSQRTRMVERRPGGAWAELDAPPHDHDSELEICGTVGTGALYVRVGERVYRQVSRPLYRSLQEARRRVDPRAVER